MFANFGNIIQYFFQFLFAYKVGVRLLPDPSMYKLPSLCEM